MGSRAAVIMFADQAPREVLQAEPVIDEGRSRRLAESLLGGAAEQVEALGLDLALWPERGLVTAASASGVDIVCSREFARNRPSELTADVLRLSGGRDAYGVFLESSEDWTGFATWSGGTLTRSLSLGVATGVIEDIGERLAFEEAFWAGGHPVSHLPDYPLPFHPIELGNEALKAFFGFVIEGSLRGTSVEPDEIEVSTFRPVGREQRAPDTSRLVRREVPRSEWAGTLDEGSC
ncbi:DUF6928 family protein [Kribbella sp. NPDC051587]|uniref:DUF6928 family protein n=1 Tax=Kribbella sp. NPDC051587 TaxID=3364119 RepID=UPI0037BD9153